MTTRLPFWVALVAWSAFCVVTASALTVPAANDFSGLAATRTSIEVIGNAGNKTRGRLLRFDADSLTLESGRREVTVNRRDVSQIYQRGDSVKNGMLIGMGIGVALGTTVAFPPTECGGYFENPRPCTGGERATLAGVFGGTLGALGFGIGAGIDALITGRRLLYQRPGPVGVIPLVSRAAGGLSISVSW